MVGTESIDSIVAARKLLASSLEKSRAIASTLDKTGSKLQEIHHRLPSFEAVSRQNCSFMAIGDHIDHAAGPAAAVVRVYDVVRELEESIFSDSCSDLCNYLSIVRRLEEALKFLADNCGLAIQWLEGAVEFLENKAAAGDGCFLTLRKSLRILRELQATNKCARLPGGCLNAAFNKLEAEFGRLLAQNSVPLPLKEQDGTASSPLPVSVIQQLQAILERLSTNSRMENCISIYLQVRNSNAKESLQALGLDYLEILVTESDEVQCIEGYIDQWINHLELAVKHLFQQEYKLCSDVFEKVGSDVWMGCFAKIVSQSGFLALLQFGHKVAQCKKDPFKLLRLLDVFAVMNKLRLDFNRLFGGAACSEIRSLTRDLIKRVVNGACDIFLELPFQVKSQRRSSPPSDGGIPRLVCFVTEFCNELLGDRYRPILAEVLAIHHIWKQEKCQEGFLTFQVYNILREIAVNLDAWSKAYEEISLSHLFMMNNHSHFCRLKGTKLGDMMGDSWLAAHEQYKDYYAALYLRESWGKLLTILSFPKGNGNGTARDMLKKRLKAFNEAFDDMFKKQCSWVVCDENLREKICMLVVQGIVPVYNSYLHNFGLVLEQDPLACNHVKYSVHKLENMLSSLFQPKLRKCGSTRQTHDLIGKIKDVVTNQFCLTLTAM